MHISFIPNHPESQVVKDIKSIPKNPVKDFPNHVSRCVDQCHVGEARETWKIAIPGRNPFTRPNPYISSLFSNPTPYKIAKKHPFSSIKPSPTKHEYQPTQPNKFLDLGQAFHSILIYPIHRSIENHGSKPSAVETPNTSCCLIHELESWVMAGCAEGVLWKDGFGVGLTGMIH